MNPVFEGGQMPLIRRIPKRGFNNKRFADVVAAVNVGDLALIFESSDVITPDSIKERGIVKQVFDQIKILGEGELAKPLNIAAHKFSASALEKIKAAGGTVNVLPEKKPVVKNKMGSRRKAAKAAAAERKANAKPVPKKSANKLAQKPAKASKPKN
jgi:large subunit ribosomal protein L15